MEDVTVATVATVATMDLDQLSEEVAESIGELFGESIALVREAHARAWVYALPGPDFRNRQGR